MLKLTDMPSILPLQQDAITYLASISNKALANPARASRAGCNQFAAPMLAWEFFMRKQQRTSTRPLPKACKPGQSASLLLSQKTKPRCDNSRGAGNMRSGQQAAPEGQSRKQCQPLPPQSLPAHRKACAGQQEFEASNLLYCSARPYIQSHSQLKVFIACPCGCFATSADHAHLLDGILGLGARHGPAGAM